MNVFIIKQLEDEKAELERVIEKLKRQLDKTKNLLYWLNRNVDPNKKTVLNSEYRTMDGGGWFQ